MVGQVPVQKQLQMHVRAATTGSRRSIRQRLRRWRSPRQTPGCQSSSRAGSTEAAEQLLRWLKPGSTAFG